MTQISDWKQTNSNFGVAQSGSYGARRAGVVLGAVDGQATFHTYSSLRYALSRGTEYATFETHFLGGRGATTATSPLVSNLASTGTVATVNGQLGGVIALSTAATDNDYVTLTLDTNFSAEKGWLFFETRLMLPLITAIVVEAGVSDAVSETAGMAFSDHTVVGVTDVATDALIFAFDTAGLANWVVNSAKAGTPKAFNTGVVAIESIYNNFAFAISPDGDAYAYINDVLVATIEKAITSNVALTPWVTVVTTTNAGAVRALRLDYLAISCSL